jgi:hypothetical protein
MNIILVLMGLVMLAVAGKGLIDGKVYCKGWYSRDRQPVWYWLSIAVLVAFGLMLIYFAKGKGQFII